LFKIELDIFSGRPNPRWTLDASEEQELMTRLLDRSVPMAPVNTSEGKLGYRGFVVRADGSTAATLRSRGMPTSFRVRDGLGESIDVASEAWLLYTGQAYDLPAGTKTFAAKHLTQRAEANADAVAACKLKRTSTTDFSKWNDEHQWDNNCYNYASNNPTDTYAQPGRGTGEMYHDITAPEILAASLRDGYLEDCADSTKKKNLHVWFCISPGWDYHWYRETKPVGGEPRWCHKMGGTPARNTDDSGHFITDPRTADRGSYTVHGSFLWNPGRLNPRIL
jgi:hypothetical protein